MLIPVAHRLDTVLVTEYTFDALERLVWNYLTNNSPKWFVDSFYIFEWKTVAKPRNSILTWLVTQTHISLLTFNISHHRICLEKLKAVNCRIKFRDENFNKMSVPNMTLTAPTGLDPLENVK